MHAKGIIQPTGTMVNVSVGASLGFLTKTRFTPKLSVGIRMHSKCFGSLLPGEQVLLELIVQRDQVVHNVVVLTVKGLGMPKIARVAAGKRYERGLTGKAGHGVPGVLLQSQTRCRG